MAELGGEQLLVIDLLKLGGHNDFIATGGDEGVDGRLEVGGEGIDVVGAWGNDDGACRSGNGDETGRGDASKVRWGHAEDADFFTTALDDGGLGEFGVGGRGADAGVVFVRVRGEGSGVANRTRIACVQRGVSTEAEVCAEEGECRAIVAHGGLARPWIGQHDVGELGRAEVPLVVADASGIKADGVHDRDVRAA